MKRIMFAPYNLNSEGCKALAISTGALRTQAAKRLKRDVVLVNWGRSDLIVRGRPAIVLNDPSAVALASNKLSCFNALSNAGVCKVAHTTDVAVVRSWVEQGYVVYGRKVLNGSQGIGIVLIQSLEDIVWCPLYTKGVTSNHEYRVHVFQGRCIDGVKKRRRVEGETNEFVKNLENGWVYCRDNVIVPDLVKEVAIDAVAALGLNFGAIDILYKKNVPYVLEVNTAPGLEGTTLEKYVNEFKRLQEIL